MLVLTVWMILDNIFEMSHYNRRYLPVHPKQPSPLDQSLPFRNNDTRLKQIYEAQITFKNKP